MEIKTWALQGDPLGGPGGREPLENHPHTRKYCFFLTVFFKSTSESCKSRPRPLRGTSGRPRRPGTPRKPPPHLKVLFFLTFFFKSTSKSWKSRPGPFKGTLWAAQAAGNLPKRRTPVAEIHQNVKTKGLPMAAGPSGRPGRPGTSQTERFPSSSGRGGAVPNPSRSPSVLSAPRFKRVGRCCWILRKSLRRKVLLLVPQGARISPSLHNTSRLARERAGVLLN